MPHSVAVIGLGVMGQRMLGSMAQSPHFNVACAWDPDARACGRTRDLYPGIVIAASVEGAITAPEVGVVYIASPPNHHAAHAIAAMEAGKAVYCEKPLGVDLDESHALVAKAREIGVVNIVNFSLASAAAVSEIERRLAANALGEVVGVDIRIHFAQWPREWQVGAAAWLSGREQGGFTREVLSHWVYLSERLFGALTLEHAAARYPGGEAAETHIVAVLSAGVLPVTIAGSVGGAGPDLVEYTIWGSRQSCRIVDWNRLYASDRGDWQAELTHIEDPRQLGYQLQLDNAAAAVEGRAHSMPDFAAALSVQVLIEAMLSR